MSCFHYPIINFFKEQKMEPTSLKQVVEDLKTDLDTYFKDAKKDIQNFQDVDGHQPYERNLNCSEWAFQIADIYEAAHGEELDLTNLPLE